MTIQSGLQTLRDRVSKRESSVIGSDGDSRDPAANAELPFSGYERLDAKQVVAGMSRHSQLELEAIELYERSHKERKPVLDKLRYMRCREPLAGYDALTPQEIVASLERADVKTIERVRAYERKFANRPDLLDDVVRARNQRRGSEPAPKPGAYRAMTVTSGESRLTSRPTG